MATAQSHRTANAINTTSLTVSIDEQMIGTKSRISFCQYMPFKPTAKWGIKVWVMASAVSGYCCNLQKPTLVRKETM